MRKINPALEAEMLGKKPVKTKKASFSWMRLFRRFLLVVLTLAIMAAGTASLFLYTVFHGPSPIARDSLTAALLEDPRTEWIPGLFLDNTQEG